MRVVQFGEAQPNELQLLSRRVGEGGGGRGRCTTGWGWQAHVEMGLSRVKMQLNLYIKCH